MTQAEREIKFNPKGEQQFKEIVSKYEVKRSALLPVLYLAQDQFGYLSNGVLDYVAARLEIPPAWVFEAASFYSMYKKKDMGKFCLQICDNISCHMMGSGALVKQVKQDLGIGHEQLAEDGVFSFRVVQCIGACDKAPAMQVNDEFVDGVTPESLRNLIAQLKEKASH